LKAGSAFDNINVMKVSAVIITFNEEENIKRCIASLGFADEVVVVDSGSRDKTAQIAKELGALVFTHGWQGYSKQKNFAVSKARNEWVLSLDADEVVSPELGEELTKIIISPYEGYSIPRRAFFLGRWINHCGWYPDLQLRLFRKKAGRFDETKQVHERFLLNGKAGLLKNDLFHYTYTNLGQYFSTLNRYTELAAISMKEKGRKGRVSDLLLNPPCTFFKMYVLKFGFLDGLPGLFVCLLSSFYNFVKYAKLWELTRKK